MWRKQCCKNRNKSVTTVQLGVWFFFSFFRQVSVLEWECGGEEAQKERLIKSAVDMWDRWDWWGSSEFHTVQRAGLQEQNTAVWRRGLGARSRRGVPRLINGTGGPSKTALPAGRAWRCSKNNLAGRRPRPPARTGSGFWRKHTSAEPEGDNQRWATPT